MRGRCGGTQSQRCWMPVCTMGTSGEKHLPVVRTRFGIVEEAALSIYDKFRQLVSAIVRAGMEVP